VERPHRRRRLVIASLSIGAAAAFTVPTLVSAGATETAGQQAATSEPTRSAAVERPTPTTSTAPTSTSSPAEAPTPDPVDAPQIAPAPPVVADPAPTADAPAPIVETAPPAPAPEEVPVVEEPATTGTLTVEVAAAPGATRQVSLRTAAGDHVAGPVVVDGTPITFADIPAGDHDLFVEHFADGGGTFLTRTPITIAAGSDLLATCDAETLDCTVD
jgi:hypothetical protein